MSNLTQPEQDYLNRRYPQPVCTCGMKMAVNWHKQDKKVYHTCEWCDKIKFLDGELEDQYRVYEDYPIPPAPTCTCGDVMTLSPNRGHMQPFHECLPCQTAKFPGAEIFNIWEGMV